MKNAQSDIHLLLVLLLGLDGGHGDTVQVTLAGLGDAAATLLLVLLENTDLLERLHDLAVNGSGGVDVVGWAGTAVLWRTVNLPETADTDGLAEVDVAGDSGGADVIPFVFVSRLLSIHEHSSNTHQSMLCGGSSLALPVLTVSTQPVDEVNIALFFRLLAKTSSPGFARDSGEVFEVVRRTWDRELSLTLQESGVGVDELVRL